MKKQTKPDSQNSGRPESDNGNVSKAEIPDGAKIDLSTLISEATESDLMERLVRLFSSGKWIISMAYVKDRLVQSETMASNFPTGDMPTFLRLVSDDMDKMRKN